MDHGVSLRCVQGTDVAATRARRNCRMPGVVRTTRVSRPPVAHLLQNCPWYTDACTRGRHANLHPTKETHDRSPRFQPPPGARATLRGLAGDSRALGADDGVADAQVIGDTKAAVAWVRAQNEHHGKVGVFVGQKEDTATLNSDIVPALKASGESWSILVVRPGRTPMAALALVQATLGDWSGNGTPRQLPLG